MASSLVLEPLENGSMPTDAPYATSPLRRRSPSPSARQTSVPSPTETAAIVRAMRSTSPPRVNVPVAVATYASFVRPPIGPHGEVNISSRSKATDVTLYLGAHTGAVNCVAFSPVRSSTAPTNGRAPELDELTMATASSDCTVRLWYVATGQCRTVLKGHTDSVRSVAYSHDGRHIVSASWDASARLWDVATGLCLARVKGHNGHVRNAVFDPESRRFATSGRDETVQLWDCSTRNDLHARPSEAPPAAAAAATAPKKQTPIAAVPSSGMPRAFQLNFGGAAPSPKNDVAKQGGKTSASNHRLAMQRRSTTTDRELDADTEDRQKEDPGVDDDGQRFVMECRHLVTIPQPGHAFTAAFSPDSRLIVTAAHSKVACIFNSHTGNRVGLLLGHTGYCTGAVFSPDGKNIVTSSWDNTIKIWDVASGATVRTLKHTSRGRAVTSVAVSPSGLLLADTTVDTIARLWDFDMGDCIGSLEGHTDTVRSVSFAPAPPNSNFHGAAAHFNAANANATFMDFLDGSRIVGTAASDRTCRVWDTSSMSCIMATAGHTDRVTQAILSPDSALLASTSEDQSGALWDTSTGRRIGVLRGHTDAVHTACWSLDGHWIATGSSDCMLRVWDVHDAMSQWQAYELDGAPNPTEANAIAVRCLVTLRGHEAPIGAVAYNNDGTRVASASTDKTVRVWDPRAGVCVAVLHGHTGVVLSVTYSQCGTRIASSSTDRTVRLWSEENARPLMTFHGHAAFVNAVAFNASGTKIFSASDDRSIRCWDTVSGRCISSIATPSPHPTEVVPSHDGSSVFVAFADNTTTTLALPRHIRGLVAVQLDDGPAPATSGVSASSAALPGDATGIAVSVVASAEAAVRSTQRPSNDALEGEVNKLRLALSQAADEIVARDAMIRDLQERLARLESQPAS